MFKMLSVVKSIRNMQIACILSLIALVIFHFQFLAEPKLEPAIIEDAAGQVFLLNGKDTPITKTKEMTKYPEDFDGYQWFTMRLWKVPICTIDIDGTEIPVVFSQRNISQRTKIVVKVVPADDEMKEILGLEEYTGANYVLVQQRSFIEGILTAVCIFLGIKLCQVGVKRAKEYAEE